MMRNFLGRSISRKILASFVGIYAATYLLTALVVFTGVRASIIGRMERHGGSATIRTGPDSGLEGTEVVLRMPEPGE